MTHAETTIGGAALRRRRRYHQAKHTRGEARTNVYVGGVYWPTALAAWSRYIVATRDR